jgi:DNA-binding NarL/FixJ family response regulator
LQLPEPALETPRVRVLVVDDDFAVRTVLCDVLAEEGFDVVGAAVDGVEGVALAASLDPDVILLDVRMPRLGGLEAARQIRPQNPNVRLVMLSAYDDPTLQHEAEAAGASAFLFKGCKLSEIVAALTV